MANIFQKRTRRGLFLKTICGAAALIASGAGAPYAAASGKTLVYCSEGSPAGFDPRQARQRSITGWLTSNPARRKLSPRLPSAGRFRKMDGNILFIYGAA